MLYRVILNPAAGRGRGAAARPVVERVLTAAGAQFDLAETTVHLDGEIFRSDAQRLEVSVLPRRLEVIGPQSFAAV